VQAAAALDLKVHGALKDLGVVHGTTKRATVLARERWHETCTRLGRIGRMPIPSKRAGHFAATSAMGAGAYAVAGRMVPKELLSGMRQWVRHACYKGSRAVQQELLLCIGDIPWRADPVLQALCKPANFLASIVQMGYHTWQEIERTWGGQMQRVGPVSALKAALRQAGVTGNTARWTAPLAGGHDLLQPLQASEGERTRWLIQARCAFDLHQLSKRVPKMGDLRKVLDVQGTIRGRKNLKLKIDRLGALRAAQCGDVVVNAQAKYWNGGHAECPCGEPIETKHHKFWDCPRWFSVRAGFLGMWTVQKIVEWLPACTLEHGLATWLDETIAWRATLPSQRPVSRRVGRKVYTDGSALHPKDGQLRVAAWAAVWRGPNGEWQHMAGPCPGEHTAARAEVAAVVEVCTMATEWCSITSDCKSTVDGFRAIRRKGGLPQNLGSGTCSDLWMQLAAIIVTKPFITIRWMPSHCTVGELCARGGTREDWEGNDQADHFAKRAVQPLAPSAQLCVLREQQLDAEARVMRIISEIQCRTLALRPRLKLASSAAKARKRAAPALPAALRQRTKTRRVAAIPAADEAQALGGLAAFACVQAREALPVAVAAAMVVGACGRPPDGCHHLQAATGPHLEWGKWNKPTNGVMQFTMHCSKCGKSAHNSTRWGLLMRTNCGAHNIQWNAERHELVAVAATGKWACSRCGLHATVSTKANIERAKCPVWVATKQGQPCPASTAWYRRWVAVAGLWRRAAYGTTRDFDGEVEGSAPALPRAELPHPAAGPEPAEHAVHGGAAAAAAPRNGLQLLRYESHWCAQLGPLLLCIKCGTSPPRTLLQERWKHEPCSGTVPVAALPRRVGAALSLGPASFPLKPILWQARWQEILTHRGLAAGGLNAPLAHGLSALARAV
jgi:hypothetical protein